MRQEVARREATCRAIGSRFVVCGRARRRSQSLLPLLWTLELPPRPPDPGAVAGDRAWS